MIETKVMDRSERFYKIGQLVNDRNVVPLNAFMDALGVSLATFECDLECMRDRLNAPLSSGIVMQGR